MRAVSRRVTLYSAHNNDDKRAWLLDSKYSRSNQVKKPLAISDSLTR
eukprot:COSAG06_NODE_54419_length_294_cov_1.328205_1_plen_46_part_10